MITITQTKSTPHPLTRFVTVEAIALLLGRNPEEIYRVDCWKNVIHVVGKGLSRFVSYADLPPILTDKIPTTVDYQYWRKRWQKQKQTKAPDFWLRFYAQKFQQSENLSELFKWGKLVGLINYVFTNTALEALREIYRQAQTALNDYSAALIG